MSRLFPVLMIALLPGAALAEDLDLKVASARMDVNLAGQPAIDITLEPQSADEFATFTRDHVGSQIFIYVRERLVTAPIIRTPITSSHLQITSNPDLHPEEMQDIADFLENQGPLTVSDQAQ